MAINSYLMAAYGPPQDCEVCDTEFQASACPECGWEVDCEPTDAQLLAYAESAGRAREFQREQHRTMIEGLMRGD